MQKGNATLLAVAAVAVAVVLLVSYIYISNGDEDGGEPGPLSGQVYIVHTNDTHGYYQENMGFGTVSQLKNDLEAQGATVFLIDAGDAFQGTATTTLTHGSSSIEVLNAVGYDLMVPGNHEFDYTFDTYLGYTEELDFPTISANIVWADTGESVFPEYLVLEKDGYSIGVFGLTTPDSADKVMAGYVDAVEFTDPVAAAQRMVDTLSDMDVDAIVAVGHIGVDPTSSITSDQICAQVDGIDLFIDGHSHTVMEDGRVADGSITLLESDTVIASTGYALSYVGLVCLTADGGIDASLVSEYESDPDVDAVIASVYAENEDLLSEVVGYTEIYLTGERTESRLGEVGMGDLVTDTMRELTGADIATINGGAVRAPMDIGEVTKNDLYTSFPFENFIVTKVLTGQQVWDLLEFGVSGLPYADGGYQQVSGLVMTYDSSQPAGQRVVSITIGGEPIDLEAEYLVASNDYMMAGGDGFEFMEDIPTEDTYGLVIDALFDRFAEIGTLTSIDTGRLIDIASS